MMGNEGISVADALALRNSGYEGGGGFGGFGGDGWWIIVLILLFGAGGWGRGGFGGNGAGGELADAFNFNQLDIGLRGIEQGLCNLGYNVQAGFNGLTNQLASCCCDLERGQDAIKYEIANVANNLLVAGDKNTDRIINYLTQTEMDKLRTELQSAQFQLSQLSQTDNIINRLMPVAKPAYLTCSPYASSFGLGNFNNYGFNNTGCGC